MTAVYSNLPSLKTKWKPKQNIKPAIHNTTYRIGLLVTCSDCRLNGEPSDFDTFQQQMEDSRERPAFLINDKINKQ